jgi:lysophospholipase L1-like esterase
MSRLLDTVLASSPTVRVVVAKITLTPAFSASARAAERAFNDRLPALVAAKGARVRLVDMTGIAQTGDGIHPSVAGYRTMAARWYAALSGWLTP